MNWSAAFLRLFFGPYHLIGRSLRMPRRRPIKRASATKQRRVVVAGQEYRTHLPKHEVEMYAKRARERRERGYVPKRTV